MARTGRLSANDDNSRPAVSGEIGRMLEGKTVLVVNGGSGSGLSVASLTDSNGARVVTASRNVLKRSGKLADSIKHSAF